MSTIRNRKQEIGNKMSNLLEEMASDAGGTSDSITNLDDSKLSSVSRLAQEADALEQQVAATEERLKNERRELRTITDERLPEAMEELGFEKLVLTDGAQVEVKQTISATINKADRPEAHLWLDEHGYGDITKRILTIVLGRGDDELVQKVRERLEELGILFKEETKVESATLRGWGREMVEAGISLPSIFNLWVGRRATLRRNK